VKVTAKVVVDTIGKVNTIALDRAMDVFLILQVGSPDTDSHFKPGTAGTIIIFDGADTGHA
jgi:hypothetical protein